MLTAVVADPDAARRGSQAFALAAGGVEVLEVDSLNAALTAVAEHAPDVVVLADELCQAIAPGRIAAALRAQPETAAVRLVVVLAHGTTVDATGADAVLERPMTPLDLVRAAVV